MKFVIFELISLLKCAVSLTFGCFDWLVFPEEVAAEGEAVLTLEAQTVALPEPEPCHAHASVCLEEEEAEGALPLTLENAPWPAHTSEVD